MLEWTSVTLKGDVTLALCLNLQACASACWILSLETLRSLGQGCCSLFGKAKGQAPQNHCTDKASYHARHDNCCCPAALGTLTCLRVGITVELVCANGGIWRRADQVQRNGRAAGGCLVQPQDAIRLVLKWPAGIKCEDLQGQSRLSQQIPMVLQSLSPGASIKYLHKLHQIACCQGLQTAGPADVTTAN